MNAAAAQAIATADWKALSPVLQCYAHQVIKRYVWRGLRVATAPSGRLSIGDRGPEDFVMEAAEKLAHGTRTYREDLDLETNLKRTIESDIDNYRKKTKRRPQPIDRTLAESLAKPEDPLNAVSDSRAKNDTPQQKELVRRQRELYEALLKSVEHDDDLSALVLAYESEKYKNAEIESETGIPAERVSELKRKLRQHADKFIQNHPEYVDLPEFEDMS